MSVYIIRIFGVEPHHYFDKNWEEMPPFLTLVTLPNLADNIYTIFKKMTNEASYLLYIFLLIFLQKSYY